MNFRNQFTGRIQVESNPGDRHHVNYVGFFDDSGEVQLEVSGVTDIYDEIQSHADSTNIYTILRRFEDGDVSVLSKAQSVFADVSGMPKTYAEMLNLIESGKHYFDSLPVEIRALFGHDVNKFIASYGTEEFFRKVGQVSDDSKPEKEVEQDVKE